MSTKLENVIRPTFVFLFLTPALVLVLFTTVSLSQERGKASLSWNEGDAHKLDYNQTVRTLKALAPDERELLIEIIATQIRPFKINLGISSENELRQISAKTRIELMDLNGDGIAEILAQANDIKAGCGVTGNCSFWVFQKASRGFKKILDSRSKDGMGGIEVVTINRTRTDKFNDLILGAHVSAAERTLYVYRYHNGQYRVSECYDANWITLKGGKRQELVAPEITPCEKEAAH